MQRSLCLGAIAATVAVLAPIILSAATLHCNSGDMRRHYCRVDTHGSVRVVKQRSDSPCIQGRTWGYDSRGIWVDRGCRADFEVAYRGGSQRSHHESHYGGNSSSYYSSGYHSGYRAGRHDDHRYYNDHYYDDDNGTDTAVAATAGAVVAAAVIAAAVKNHNKHKREETLAPSWATGRFSGYDPLAARDIDLSIYSGGAVQGLNSSFGLSGSWDGDRLHLGGREYDVTERGGGFVARDRRDSDHVIFFRRGG